MPTPNQTQQLVVTVRAPNLLTPRLSQRPPAEAFENQGSKDTLQEAQLSIIIERIISQYFARFAIFFHSANEVVI